MRVYDDCVCVYDMCDYRRVHLWTYCWIILSDLKWPHLQKQPVTVIFHDYCVFCVETMTLQRYTWNMSEPNCGFPNSCALGHARY